MSGRFITFEGIDGAGKSSHIESLATLDPRQGPRRCSSTREPGGTPLAEQLRAHFLRDEMDALTECLLVFAARRDHLQQRIEPALAARHHGAVRPLHRRHLRVPGRRPRLRLVGADATGALGAGRSTARSDAVVRCRARRSGRAARGRAPTRSARAPGPGVLRACASRLCAAPCRPCASASCASMHAAACKPCGRRWNRR